MSLPTILTHDQFIGQFFVKDVVFTLNPNVEMSGEDGNGVPFTNSRGEPFWEIRMVTQPLSKAKAALVRGRFNFMVEHGYTALLHDKSLPYPEHDTGGVLAAAAAATIGSITDRSLISFSSAPASYDIPGGSYFSVNWSSTKRFLSQILEDRTSSGGGAVTSVSISPRLPEDVIAGASVTFYRPACRARMVEGSLRPSWSGGKLQELTFQARSSLEA